MALANRTYNHRRQISKSMGLVSGFAGLNFTFLVRISWPILKRTAVNTLIRCRRQTPANCGAHNPRKALMKIPENEYDFYFAWAPS